MVSEQADFLDVLKYTDKFRILVEDPDFKTKAEIDEDDYDEMKYYGYFFGRENKFKAMNLDPVFPTAMRHHCLVQDPETKVINHNHPVTKAVNKIRFSNLFTGGSLSKAIGKMEVEETTGWSFSTNSKVHEFKSSYRKHHQHTEDTMPVEMLSSVGSGKQAFLDSKKSLISNQSKAASSEKNQMAHHKSEPMIYHNIAAEKPVKSKSKIKFNYEYKPSIISSSACMCVNDIRLET